jgi:hypothetical protein
MVLRSLIPEGQRRRVNSAAGMSGSMQYDYLIIPHQPGDYKIPRYIFTLLLRFLSREIQSQSSPELALKITGAPSQNPNAGATAMVNKEDVASLHSDIRFIKTKSELQKAPKPLSVP